MTARTRDSEYVFPSRQGARKPHLFDLRKPFHRACRESATENFRLHDLRHTFASVAVMIGASLFDVQKLLGHKDIAMTQHTLTSLTRAQESHRWSGLHARASCLIHASRPPA